MHCSHLEITDRSKGYRAAIFISDLRTPWLQEGTASALGSMARVGSCQASAS